MAKAAKLIGMAVSGKEQSTFDMPYDGWVGAGIRTRSLREACEVLLKRDMEMLGWISRPKGYYGYNPVAAKGVFWTFDRAKKDRILKEIREAEEFLDKETEFHTLDIAWGGPDEDIVLQYWLGKKIAKPATVEFKADWVVDCTLAAAYDELMLEENNGMNLYRVFLLSLDDAGEVDGIIMGRAFYSLAKDREDVLRKLYTGMLCEFEDEPDFDRIKVVTDAIVRL